MSLNAPPPIVNKEEQLDKAWQFFFDNLQEDGHSGLGDNFDFPVMWYPDFLDRLKNEYGNPVMSSERTGNRFTRKELLLTGDNLFRIYYGSENKPTLIQAHKVKGEGKTIVSDQELKDLESAGLDVNGLSTS